MKKEIDRLCPVPRLYGTAYRCFDKDSVVCYPVPIHLVVRWSRDFWAWVRFAGLRTYRERLEGELYDKGYAAAAKKYSWDRQKEAVQAHRKGWLAACDALEGKE